MIVIACIPLITAWLPHLWCFCPACSIHCISLDSPPSQVAERVSFNHASRNITFTCMSLLTLRGHAEPGAGGLSAWQRLLGGAPEEKRGPDGKVLCCSMPVNGGLWLMNPTPR